MPASVAPDLIPTVRDLHQRGFPLIALRPGTKKPVDNAWQTLRYTEEEVIALFSGATRYNPGVILGIKHGDGDMDCTEAVKLAPYFLPRTGMKFGRASKPVSHYIYEITEPIPSKEYLDPTVVPGSGDKPMMVEFRSTGGQTMFPGAIHPDGEAVVWASFEEPTVITAEQVSSCFGRLAAASLIARVWNKTSRHWTALYLAGGLLKGGWTLDKVDYFFDAIFSSGAVHDEERADRMRAIRDTATRHEAGESVAGWPAAAEQLGAEVVNRIQAWLALENEKKRFKLSDEGNAQRFVARFVNEIRYCPEMGQWLCWDTRCWQFDRSDRVTALSRETVRFINQEALEETDEDQRTLLAKWAAASQNVNRILAIQRLARADPAMQIHADQLDSQPWLLNARNGTINLRTGGLQPFSRDDYLTHLCTVEYNPAARSLLWEGYLDKAFQSNADMIEYVQRSLGYSATGFTNEDCFFFAHGPTRAGKSTLMHALSVVMGDYAQSTRPEVFMTRSGDPIPNEIAAMVGIRFSITTETEEGQKLATSLVKRMTGGDRMRGRFLFKEFFEFTPQFHIWIATNNRPVIPGSDGAIWERVRLVPFLHQFIGESEQDKSFRDRLPLEAGEAILAWIVAGVQPWIERGLGEPPAVTQAIALYRDDMDTVAHFLDEACLIAADQKVGAGLLWTQYLSWIKAHNEKPMTQNSFKDDLLGRHYTQKRESQGMIWEGIGLRTVEIINDVDPVAALHPDPYGFGRPSD